MNNFSLNPECMKGNLKLMIPPIVYIHHQLKIIYIFSFLFFTLIVKQGDNFVLKSENKERFLKPIRP